MKVEVAKAKQRADGDFYAGWTVRREKLTYTGWRGREIEMGMMCNRLGRLRMEMEMY